MSAVDIVDKTAGVSKTDESLLLIATEEGNEVLVSEHSPIDVVRDIPTEPFLKWTSIFGPLSWTVPGIEIEKEAAKGTAPINIWDKPSILTMLRQPIGAPVSLTKDEALEIALQAFGSRPDLIPGEDFVRQVRPLIGRSILRKLKKSRD